MAGSWFACPGLDDLLFLGDRAAAYVRQRTSGDDHVATFGKGADPLCEFVVRGGTEIVLEIAEELDEAGWDSEIVEPGCGFFALGEPEGHRPGHAQPELAERQGSLVGAVADAGVDYGDGDVVPLTLAEDAGARARFRPG